MTLALTSGAGSRPARAARLFGRNTLASILAFTLDVALLFAAVELAGIGYYPAAAGAFLIAMTFHYVLSRLWVFRGTRRGVGRGYVYFLINSGIGLVVTMAAFVLLMELFGLHYLLARLIASAVAGILVFFLNAVFNFKAL